MPSDQNRPTFDPRIAPLLPLLDLSPVAMLLTEIATGRILAMNAQAERLFQIEAEQVVGRTTTDLRFWKSASQRDSYLMALRDSPDEATLGLTIERGDGSFRQCLLNGRTFGDDPGSRVALTSFQDVTELKEAQEALRASEANYRLLSEKTSDIVMRVRQGRVAFISPSVEGLTGWSPDERMGSDPFELIHPDDAPVLREAYARLLEGDSSIRPVYRLLRRDGTWIWIESALFLVRDASGSVVETVSSSYEVTRRLAQDEALRESERRLREVADTSLDMLSRHDLDGICLWASPASRSILGVEPEVAVGRDAFEFIAVEFHEPVRRALGLLAEHGQSSLQYRICRPDGTGIWAETLWTLTRDSEGRPREILCSTRDVSERRAQEDALRRSEESYRILAENSLDMVTRHDLQGNYLWASPSTRTVLGFEPENVLGTSCHDMFHPDDLDRVRATLQKILSEPVVAKVVYRHRTASGNWLWVESIARAVRNDSDGTVQEILASTRDISERKNAEDRYRSLFENLSTGFSLHEAVLDASGEVVDFVFLEVNPAYQAITGHAADSVIGRRGSEVLAHFDPAWIRTYGRVALDGVPLRVERRDPLSGRWYETLAYRPTPGQFALLVADITERRVQEQALRRSEADYRLLADNSTDVITRITLDGNIAYISPSIESELGWPPERYLGSPATLGMHPEDIPAVLAAGALVRGGQRIARPVYRAQHADGSWRWVEASLQPILDSEGVVTGLVGSARDITDRHAAEQALKEREERLRLVLDATSDGVFDWDVPSGAMHFSTAIYTMLGYEVEAFPSRIESWRDLLHPEDSGRVIDLIKAHLADPAVRYQTEFRLRTRDGGWKWIMVRAKVVQRAPDGTPLRMVGTHTDITERKTAERALAESEARFRGIADLSQDMLTRHDLSLGCLWASPASRAILREEPAVLLGRTPFEYIVPEDAPTFREVVSELMVHGRASVQYRLRRADGSLVWAESIWCVACDPEGRPFEIQCATRDIGERKRQSKLLEDTQRLARLGGWEADLETGSADWTRELRDMFGLPANAPIPGRRELRANLEESSRAVFDRITERMLADGTSWDVVLKGVTIDGRPLITRSTCSAELGADGRPRVLRGAIQDITEQEALRERLDAESRLNQIILSTTEALVLLLDRDGRVVRFNKACERASGWSEAEVLGRDILDLLVPEDERERVRSLVGRIESGELPRHNENHWIARDGRKLWISWENSALRDETGETRYVLSTGIDMTRQRATQLELERTQERWRVLIETAPEAILILDVERKRFLQANPAAEALFGLPVREIVSRGPAELSPSVQPSGVPTDKALTDVVQAAIQEGSTSFEWMHQRSDGREILCQVNLSRIPSEDGTLLRVSLLDITDARKTESVMEALVQRTSSLFGQAFFDALVRDLAGLLEVRHAFVARLEPDGRHIRTLSLFADRNLAVPMTYPIAGTPCGTTLEQGLVFQASGVQERYPGALLLEDLEADSFMSVPLLSASRRPIGVLAVVDSKPMPGGELARSILAIFAGRAQGELERMEAESALRRLNNDLENRVQERTSELVSMNRELESFSYSVSHDLRSPLRSIDGFALALAEDYAPGLDDTARGYLDRIRSASHRMSELIDDLLTLSRSSRRALHKSDIDLSAMATEILEALATTEPARRVDVGIEPGLHAHGDPVLLRAVLENLLGNAWKYTRRRERARIAFGATPAAEGMRGFAVSDDGAGFDMAFSHKLFGTFQRLHGSEEFEGNGIGLATVKRILERHGGRVHATGEIDKGAVFGFELPDRGD